MKPLLLIVFFWCPENDPPSLPHDTLLTKKDVSWQVNFRKFDLPISVQGEIRLTVDHFIFHVNKKQHYNSNYFRASDSSSIDIVIPIDSITKIKKVLGGLIIKTKKQLYMFYITRVWKEFGNIKFFDDVILMLIKRKSKKKIWG